MASEIGERIKKLRSRKDWSLRELERRTNINYSVLSRIEAGKRPVTDSEIMIFANLFSVSPNELLGYEEEDYVNGTRATLFHDQIGITKNDYTNLSSYQKEVLDWAIEEDVLFFKDKPKSMEKLLERLEIAYEVNKVMEKRKKNNK